MKRILFILLLFGSVGVQAQLKLLTQYNAMVDTSVVTQKVKDSLYAHRTQIGAIASTYLSTSTAATTYDPIITAANTAKYHFNGYKKMVALSSDSMVEGTTNLFFTVARAQAASTAFGTFQDLQGSGTPAITRYGISQVASHYRRKITGAALESFGIYDTLTASANNATLVGLSIAPVFQANSFTGTTQTSLTVSGNTVVQLLTTGAAKVVGTLSVNSDASTNKLILGQYSMPAITFNSSTGQFMSIGLTQTAADGVPATLVNDGYIKMSNGGLVIGMVNGTGNLPNRWRMGSDGSVVHEKGGTLTAIPSALYAMNSTTQGFLMPAMTTTQKNAIGSPATGLQVYDTNMKCVCTYNGTLWTNAPIISSGTAAPTTIPMKIGDQYVDATNKKIYFATGTTAASDWTIVN